LTIKESEMPKYLVTNTYRSTGTVEVEADSEDAALELALSMEDVPNNDDSLYDSTAKEIEP